MVSGTGWEHRRPTTQQNLIWLKWRNIFSTNFEFEFKSLGTFEKSLLRLMQSQQKQVYRQEWSCYIRSEDLKVLESLVISPQTRIIMGDDSFWKGMSTDVFLWLFKFFFKRWIILLNFFSPSNSQLNFKNPFFFWKKKQKNMRNFRPKKKPF